MAAPSPAAGLMPVAAESRLEELREPIGGNAAEPHDRAGLVERPAAAEHALHQRRLRSGEHVADLALVLDRGAQRVLDAAAVERADRLELVERDRQLPAAALGDAAGQREHFLGEARHVALGPGRRERERQLRASRARRSRSGPPVSPPPSMSRSHGRPRGRSGVSTDDERPGVALEKRDVGAVAADGDVDDERAAARRGPQRLAHQRRLAVAARRDQEDLLARQQIARSAGRAPPRGRRTPPGARPRRRRRGWSRCADEPVGYVSCVTVTELTVTAEPGQWPGRPRPATIQVAVAVQTAVSCGSHAGSHCQPLAAREPGRLTRDARVPQLVGAASAEAGVATRRLRAARPRYVAVQRSEPRPRRAGSTRAGVDARRQHEARPSGPARAATTDSVDLDAVGHGRRPSSGAIVAGAGRAPGRRGAEHERIRRTAPGHRQAGGRRGRDRHPAGWRVRVQVEPRLDRRDLPGRVGRGCRPAARARAGGAAARWYRRARDTRHRTVAAVAQAAAATSPATAGTSGRPAARAAISGGTIITPASADQRGIDEHRRDDRQPAQDRHEEPQQVVRLRAATACRHRRAPAGTRSARAPSSPRRDRRQQQAGGEQRQHPQIGRRRREPERQRGQHDPAPAAPRSRSATDAAVGMRAAGQPPAGASHAPADRHADQRSAAGTAGPGRAYQG